VDGGAVPGPIAAAPVARDHGGPQRWLGAPVGGIDGRRIQQEGEERGEFYNEMRREPLHIGHGPWLIEALIHTILEMPAGDGKAARGHAPRVVGPQEPTASEQTRETRLGGRRA
jgi:hypothetical protein